MKITIATHVRAPIGSVWHAWTTPADIAPKEWQAVLDRFARHVEGSASRAAGAAVGSLASGA